jgi:hypothetical protein
MTRNLKPVPFTEYYSGFKIKKDEIGAACGMHGRKQRYTRGFGDETRRKETTWKI